jgi:hypothetical protein
MQSEQESNAIAWGLDGFQKSSLRVMTDTFSHGNLQAVPLDQELIITRGSCFLIGIEVFPSSKWTKGLDEFISTWEAQSGFLQFQLQLQHGQNVIHRETTPAHKTQTDLEKQNALDGVVITRSSGGLFIGTRTSIQIPTEHSNKKITMNLVLSVVVPQSKMPSNHCRGMSVEELEVRALLESGRYHPPRVPPKEISLPMRVLESLEVKCWSQSIEPTTALVCIELRNAHPHKSLLIHHLEVNLEGSLRIEEMAMSCVDGVPSAPVSLGKQDTEAKVIFISCEPPLNVGFDMLEVCSQNKSSLLNPIVIGAGEGYNVVYNISPKSVINEVLATVGNPQILPLSSCGPPPVNFSGNFITPVEVRWVEGDSELRPAEKDCVVTSTSLCWSVENRLGREFTIEFDGPPTAQVLEPITLRLTISNFTSDKRHVKVFLQRPDCVNKLFHISET